MLTPTRFLRAAFFCRFAPFVRAGNDLSPRKFLHRRQIMSKKLLFSIALCFTALCCLFTATACKKDEKDDSSSTGGKEHVHVFREIEVAISDTEGYYLYECDCGYSYKGDSYTKVEVCKHPSYGKCQSLGDGTHVKYCENCGLAVTESCRGGTATCKDLAVCQDCHEPYGDFAEHKLSEDLLYDDDGHYRECYCGYQADFQPHDFEKGELYDDWHFDEKGHWHECSCGYKENERKHTSSGAATETSDEYCVECKYVITPAYGHICSLHLDKMDRVESTCTTEGNIDGGAFYHCANLTNIVIPDSVSSIGVSTFSGCSNLTSIRLSENVTSIESWLFYGCSKPTDITIPYGVISVGNCAFQNCVGLTSVTLPDTVTSIGYSAFDGCNNLTSISLPDDLKSIGEFKDCTSLLSITIGDSVTSIDNQTFYNCTALRSVTIGNGVTSIGSDAFYNCTSLTEVIIPDSVTSLALSVFEDCINLRNVVFGDGLTVIPDVFTNCRNLLSVTIGRNVSEIPGYSNYKLYKLVEIINKSSLDITKENINAIAPNVLKIKTEGESDVINCNDFLFLTSDDGTNYLVDYLGQDADLVLPDYYDGQNYLVNQCAFRFRNICSNITIGEGVSAIYGNPFDFSKVEKIVFNAINCEDFNIPNFGFSSQQKEVEVFIGKQVKRVLGNFAYFGDISRLPITKVVFEENSTCESIGKSAFELVESLTYVNLPDSLISIGDKAFNCCYNCENIAIPYNVTTIGKYAFCSCDKLMTVTIPAKVTSIGSSAFSSNHLVEIINYSGINVQSVVGVSSPVLQIKSSGTSDIVNVGDYSFITVDGKNYLIAYLGNDADLVLPNDYEGKGYSIHKNAFAKCKFIKSVIIPDGVTMIDDRAFEACKSLENITLPDSLISIGAGVFSECFHLNDVTIPDSVTSIGTTAFYGCLNIEYINIPVDVISIGYRAFASCGITTVDWNATACASGSDVFDSSRVLTTVNFGDDVTMIPQSAFRGCTGLTSITIPDSVTSIGNNAFSGCTGLTNVYYCGTEKNWQNVMLGSSNQLLTSATIYYYSEEAPEGEGNYWHYDENGEIAVWGAAE